MAPAPWDADNGHGTNALQVLVEWLTTRDAATREDNFARLSKGDELARKAMYDEILGLFEANGICDRTQHGLVVKLGKLKAQVNNARRLMLVNGLEDRSNLDDCTEKIKHEILKRCPNFELLAPVMTPFLKPLDVERSRVTRESTEAQSKPNMNSSTEQEAKEELRGSAQAALKTVKNDDRPRKRTRVGSEDANVDGSQSHLQQVYELDLENKRRQNEHEQSNRKIDRLLRKVRAKKELVDLGMSEEEAEQELRRI